MVSHKCLFVRLAVSEEVRENCDMRFYERKPLNANFHANSFESLTEVQYLSIAHSVSDQTIIRK